MPAHTEDLAAALHPRSLVIVVAAACLSERPSDRIVLVAVSDRAAGYDSSERL
jgi:hypothetical protein